MSVHTLELQITRIHRLLGITQNQRTIRIYCRQLVAFMEKRKALTDSQSVTA